MTKQQRVKPGERLKSTVTKAFQLWRPFERQFRESLEHIEHNGIRLAEITSALEKVLGNLKLISSDITELPEFNSIEQFTIEAQRLAEDTQTTAVAMEYLLNNQSQSVTDINIATMKLKEHIDDPQHLGEDLIDLTTIIANWDFLVQNDPDILRSSLEAPLQSSRLEAIEGLQTGLIEAWINDLLEVRSKRT